MEREWSVEIQLDTLELFISFYVIIFTMFFLVIVFNTVIFLYEKITISFKCNIRKKLLLLQRVRITLKIFNNYQRKVSYCVLYFALHFFVLGIQNFNCWKLNVKYQIYFLLSIFYIVEIVQLDRSKWYRYEKS